MRTAFVLTGSLALTILSVSVSFAQDSDRPTDKKRDDKKNSDQPPRGRSIVERMLARDANKDGKLSKDEAPDRMKRRFDQIDKNSDGFIDRKELEELVKQFGGQRGRPGGRRPGGRRPGGRRPGQGRSGRDRPDNAQVKQGDAAPDFKLKTLAGDREVQLSSFETKKPVAIIFGSCT